MDLTQEQTLDNIKEINQRLQTFIILFQQEVMESKKRGDSILEVLGEMKNAITEISTRTERSM